MNENAQSISDSVSVDDLVAHKDGLVLHKISLVATFLKETNFIAKIDSIIPKFRSHKVTHGEALAVLMLVAVGDALHSIRSVHKMLCKYPILDLLDIKKDIKPEQFSRDVMAQSLSALSGYGLQQLYRQWYTEFNDFIQHHLLLNGNLEDSSSYDLFLDQILVNSFNISNQEPKAYLMQYILSTILDRVLNLIEGLNFKNFKINDKITFDQVSQRLLDDVKALFKHDKYLVVDSEFASADFFNFAKQHNLQVIVRCNAESPLAEYYLSHLESDKLSPISEFNDEILPYSKRYLKGYLLKDRLHEQDVSVAVIQQLDLTNNEEDIGSNLAIKEYNYLKEQLKTKFTSKKEADAFVKKLKAECKYCTITHRKVDNELQYECYWHRATKGRPVKGGLTFANSDLSIKELAKTPNIRIKYIYAVCDLSFKPGVLVKNVNFERLSALICTDPNLELSKLVSFAQRDYLESCLWDLVKLRRMSFSSFDLKREDRLDALLFVLFLALSGYVFAQFIIKSK